MGLNTKASGPEGAELRESPRRLSSPGSDEFDSTRGPRLSYRWRRRFESAALVTLGVVICLAPQLLGGVYAWSLWITAPLSLLCLALLLSATWAEPELQNSPGPVLALATAALWTGIQLIPLPVAFTRALAPDLASRVERAWALAGSPRADLLPLSVDPGETRIQLLQMLAILAIFITSWVLTARGERKRVIQIVTGSCCLMALVGLAHQALGLTRIFGLYEPIYAEPRLLAPLLNDNNLAGFFCLGLPPALALGWAERRSPLLRQTYFAGAALLTIALLFTLSRAGIVVGIIVALATLALLLFSERQRQPLSPLSAAVGAIITMVTAIGISVASDPLFREFDGGLDAKASRIGEAFHHAFEAPIFGYGRGAFAATFAERSGGILRPEYAENLIAQWAADWGWPIALLVIGTFVWSILRTLGAARSRSRLGALLGVIAIALHGLADFGLEISGVALAASALAGAGLAPVGKVLPSNDQSIAPWFRLRVIALTTLGLTALSLLLYGANLDHNSRYRAQDRLEAQLAAGYTIPANELSQLIRLHPLEPVFPLIAGAQANRDDDPTTLRWLNHAMRLAPEWASPHMQAAIFLTRRGRLSQATLELREAGQRNPRATQGALCDFLSRWPSAAYAERAAPVDSPQRELMLAHASGCLRDIPLQADLVDRLLLESSPEQSAPRVRIALRALARGEANEALEALTPVLQPPVNFDVSLAHARSLLRADRASEAREVLSEMRADGRSERQRLARWKAQTATQLGDEVEMRASIDALRSDAHGEPERIEESWVLRAQLERQLGNKARAFTCWEAAYQVRQEPTLLARAARLAERLSENARALRYWATLCEAGATSLDPCSEVERIQRINEP